MSTNELTKAKARIAALADEGSFVELGARVKARSTDFAASCDAEGDGVVTGYATVAGKLVYIYSQEPSVYGGSLGEMHAEKIAKLYDLAMKMGAPVIALVDCSGVRLEESTDALNGFGKLFLSQAKASGLVPQITAVYGRCGGGMAISAGLSDFVFMEAKNAQLFVNAPNTLDGNYVEKCDTAKAEYQAKNSGIVDCIGSEDEIAAGIRALVSILPSNNEEAAVEDGQDDLNRMTAELEGVTDAKAIISSVADSYVFVETKKEYAKDIVTGFIRLDGVTTGVVANAEEKLSPEGLKKAASFVNFCDAFEIPVISFTSADGFTATVAAEKDLAKAASDLVYAFANATVPKISVITGDTYASAYTIMNSKAIGADIVYAVEDARVGIMEASSAAKIIGGEDLSEVAGKFDEKQTALAAAGRGYVDELISMSTLRKNILIALEMLFNKRGDEPFKKHGSR